MAATPPKHRVELTEDELLLLDGKCESATQRLVDRIKAERELVAGIEAEGDEARMVARIVRSTQESYVLRKQFGTAQGSGGRCDLCQKTPGYYTYSRSGRYARKGAPNYDRPCSWQVIVYNDVKLCSSCAKLIEEPLRKALDGIVADIPAELGGGAYKAYPLAHCTSCKWRGHEGQMKPRMAMMGGTYPGGCPECDAENTLFRTMIKTSSKNVALVDQDKNVMLEHRPDA